jgi:hypothetical protein
MNLNLSSSLLRTSLMASGGNQQNDFRGTHLKLDSLQNFDGVCHKNLESYQQQSDYLSKELMEKDDIDQMAHSDSKVCELLEIGNECSTNPPKEASIQAFSRLEAFGIRNRPANHKWAGQAMRSEDFRPGMTDPIKRRVIRSALGNSGFEGLNKEIFTSKKITSRLAQEEADPLEFYEKGKFASLEQQRKQAVDNNLGMAKTLPTFLKSSSGVGGSRDLPLGKIPWRNKSSRDGHIFSAYRSQEYKLLMIEGHSKLITPLQIEKKVTTVSKEASQDSLALKKVHKLDEDIKHETTPAMTTIKGCFLYGKKKRPTKDPIQIENLGDDKEWLSYTIFNRQNPTALENKITKILQKDDSNLKNIYFMGMLRKLCRVQRTSNDIHDNPTQMRISADNFSTQRNDFGVRGTRQVPRHRVSIKKSTDLEAKESTQVVAHFRSKTNTNPPLYQDLTQGSIADSINHLKEVALKQSFAKKSFDSTKAYKRISSEGKAKLRSGKIRLLKSDKSGLPKDVLSDLANYHEFNGVCKNRIKIFDSETSRSTQNQANRENGLFP